MSPPPTGIDSVEFLLWDSQVTLFAANISAHFASSAKPATADKKTIITAPIRHIVLFLSLCLFAISERHTKINDAMQAEMRGT
jgi:hypothetical protein